MDLRRGHAGIGQDVAGDIDRPPDGAGDHCIEFGPGQGVEGRLAGNLQPTRGLLTIRELFLHVAGQREGRLDGRLVDPIVEAVAFALGQQAFGNGPIEIVAAQRRIAAGRQHLKHPLLQPQQREVEGAAAQVVDGIEPFGALIEAVGQGRRRRLVHQAQYFEASHAGGIARRRPCRVVEIGRHGNDRPLDRLLQRLLGALAQRLQDLGGNLDR